jgi:hypothetical protein
MLIRFQATDSIRASRVENNFSSLRLFCIWCSSSVEGSRLTLCVVFSVRYDVYSSLGTEVALAVLEDRPRRGQLLCATGKNNCRIAECVLYVLDASKQFNIEGNVEKLSRCCIFMSHHQNSGQNRN